MHMHMNTFRVLGTQQRKELCSSPYKSVHQRQHFWSQEQLTHKKKKKKKKITVERMLKFEMDSVRENSEIYTWSRGLHSEKEIFC